jgi:hypothetical protein
MCCNLFWVGMLSGIQGILLVQVRTTYTYYGHTRQQIEAQQGGVHTCLVGIPAVSTRSLALMNTLGVHVTDNGLGGQTIRRWCFSVPLGRRRCGH